ncbi:MAG TPA: hypothetical protein VGZ47_20190 [Gemmataceae bacterium]|jgi:type I restriction-modification system DNA methylase subunit|nr:hypothetical protein [Gemmataceae bacterium]
MIAPQKIQAAVAQVRDQKSLLQTLLADTLAWPIPDAVKTFEEVAYSWTDDDLRTQKLRVHIWQVVLQADQAFGIFVVEFPDDDISRTVLRQVLRGLVPSRKRDSKLPYWQHDNLLFICTTKDYHSITFAHFRGEKAHSARLATFGWQQDDPKRRTLCEFNLREMGWPANNGADREAWKKQWAKAFDKEKLTKDFFKRFSDAVEAVKADLEKHQKMKSAEAYSKAQLLLERLVFLYFLQNRGWLDQKRDYLLHHFQAYRQRPKEFSYYGEFLEKLFWTLASAPGPGNRFAGIPFLNGGLFDDDEFDPSPRRLKQNPPLQIQNETFDTVFRELLEAFNFTVREDTPLDQDVAVDPEMLGKVFESIVLHAEAADPDAVAPDKRKATGSYYTPRIVVHFICREVLVQYLQRQFDWPDWPARLRGLFALDASHGLAPDDLPTLKKLLSPKEGAALRDNLRDLKCCDPAVGSGAFPVGLLHELLVLRRIVETAANGYVDPVRKEGANWLHDVKEDIVENCLFGVDIQQQAIEICRLRLWLSLVVDYDIGVDPFNAERTQFAEAIGRISQLPNLEMNFHRGDSLLDLISDVPVRIERGALGQLKKQVKELQDLSQKLHHAKTGERKKDLRIQILRRRLDLTEQVLTQTMHKFRAQDSHAAAVLFGETAKASERRKRFLEEITKLQKALEKLAADRTDLEKLAKQPHDPAFYPKLRRLEGADFDSPFNFSWQLDFAEIFSPERGGFDIVVGNPPFVTARNPVKRDLYRERWPRVCTGNYLLLCPFFELSFGIMRSGGQLGFIVSNAFARRDVGKSLVEKVFPTINLQKILDCSGLLFPGHGTPTCLVFASIETPAANKPIRVAGILPGGGDLRTPPEESPLWKTLEEKHDSPGYSDEKIVVDDRPRATMNKHPWLFDNRGERTHALLTSKGSRRLREFTENTIGRDASTQCDDVYYLPEHLQRRIGVETEYLKPLIVGELIRNWHFAEGFRALWPYNASGKARLSKPTRKFLHPFEPTLSERSQFNKTIVEAGLEWYEYREYYRRGLTVPQIVYAYIATHFHATLCERSSTMNRHALLFTPRTGFSKENIALVIAFLNSSTPLFWLKQVCFNKGAGDDEERDRYELAGGKVEEIPVPDYLAAAFVGENSQWSQRVASMSQVCLSKAQQMPSLAFRQVFHHSREAYHAWNSSLPGYVAPHESIGKPFANSEGLRAAFQRVIDLRE